MAKLVAVWERKQLRPSIDDEALDVIIIDVAPRPTSMIV